MERPDEVSEVEVVMTNSGKLGAKLDRSLWLFRGLLMGESADMALEAACETGRMERWGHAAQIPLWTDPDEVILVVDGNVVAERSGLSEIVRLGRGDAFGLTLQARSSTAPEGNDELITNRETTICAIPSHSLREIWDSVGAPRRVEAGRWPRKQEVEVPTGLLFGTLPTTRVARILVHLVENYGEIQGSKGRLPIGLRPRDMASLAGISKGRANQVWRLFLSTGVVEVEGRSLIFSDVQELRRYAVG